MKEIFNQIFQTTAGQIVAAVLTFLSGKWIFEYWRAKKEIDQLDIDLEAKKVEVLTRQFLERNKVINVLQKNIEALQEQFQTLMHENLALKKEVYELKGEFEKNKQELKECLEDLSKYRRSR